MAQERDDLEFASKEDLEEIAKNPALQKIYNAMQAGVTKKFQGWSGERKQLADTLTTLSGTLQQWEEWRPIIDSIVADGTLDSYRDDGRGHDDTDSRNRGRGDDRDTRRGRGRGDDNRDDSRVIDTLKGYVRRDEVERAAQTFTGELQTVRRMLDLSLQLDDLHRNHLDKRPDIKFDRQKILQTAVDRGYTNLEDAYNSAYRDDFIKRDVDTQVESRIKEELARRNVPGETGSGIMPSHFKLPEGGSPKSFSDATRQTLEELKSGTLTAEKK